MANQTPGFFADAKTAAHPRSANGQRRSTLSPVRRAYQAVVLVGYAVLGVAVPMVVSAIREWRR
jgi:hypothetical protein